MADHIPNIISFKIELSKKTSEHSKKIPAGDASAGFTL